MRLTRVTIGTLVAAAILAPALTYGLAQRGPRAADTMGRGADFLIKSQLDPNFCIQVGTGTKPGRTIALQQCGLADVQRWTFTLNSDDTNFIVESQGMCLDGHLAPAEEGLPLQVARCKTTARWRFELTAVGLIRNVGSGLCLSIPGAASNANVSRATCDETKATQRWVLVH